VTWSEIDNSAYCEIPIICNRGHRQKPRVENSAVLMPTGGLVLAKVKLINVGAKANVERGGRTVLRCELVKGLERCGGVEGARRAGGSRPALPNLSTAAYVLEIESFKLQGAGPSLLEDRSPQAKGCSAVAALALWPLDSKNLQSKPMLKNAIGGNYVIAIN
jgi:hypothetical protein